MSSKVLCAISLAFVAACTVEEPAHKSEAPAQAPVAVHPPAAAPAAAPAPLMSQDEADAKAAKAITKENADAELEKLKKELSGG
jgi:hypothetical protein